MRNRSFYSVSETTGGVAPLEWLSPATIVTDEALNDYKAMWAAAGHSHAVFPTTFEQLKNVTGAYPMIVALD